MDVEDFAQDIRTIIIMFIGTGGKYSAGADWLSVPIIIEKTKSIMYNMSERYS